MSQLLAMSFDVPTSPSIWLGNEQTQEGDLATGWGFAWYPGGDLAAAVIRDPRPVSDRGLMRVLRDWDRFRSTAFLCHIRGAAKRPSERDTHPFDRTYAGRDFVFAHNGQLDTERVRELPLADRVLEPMGTTDSERAFCWLLGKIRDAGAGSLKEAGYERVHAWLRELNELGTLTVVLSDGEDVLAYQDANGFRPLHFVRLKPPHESTRLQSATVRLDHSDALDSNRTMVLVATTALGAGWERMADGSLLVARRGSFVHRPDTEGSSLRTRSSSPSPIAAPEPPRRYRVLHRTKFEYAEPVERSTHTLRLQPVDGYEQRLLHHELRISVAADLRRFEDVFGNRTVRFRVERPYSGLEFVAESIVEVYPIPLPTPRNRASLPMVWMPWQRQMMTPYLLPMELPETQLRELSAFAESFAERQDYDVLQTLADINRTINADFSYVPRVTSNETTPFEVYVSRRGVCQDFANLFICLARLLGVPARYRVGYIHTGANYENQMQSEASHAWAEVYLPWAGWRGFDPTNGCQAGLDHVCVAVGRNYRDATPTSGTLYRGGRSEKLSVSVEIEQITTTNA